MTTPTYAARGRVGRGRPWGPVHAVPSTDTTRSALCGAPVRGGRRSVPAQPGTSSGAAVGRITCPDCVAVGAAAG